MWKEIPEERYDEFLGVLPPAHWTGKGFLVGEPFDHRRCTITGEVRASYGSVHYLKGKFYEGPNMTRPELMPLM